jgi:hypothetical protein
LTIRAGNICQESPDPIRCRSRLCRRSVGPVRIGPRERAGSRTPSDKSPDRSDGDRSGRIEPDRGRATGTRRPWAALRSGAGCGPAGRRRPGRARGPRGTAPATSSSTTPIPRPPRGLCRARCGRVSMFQSPCGLDQRISWGRPSLTRESLWWGA